MARKIHRPGRREKSFFFLSGAIISTPFPILASSLISMLLVADFPTYHATLISTAILAPILEEFAKVYPLFYRHGETERSIMTLGFFTGLGFGIVEFILYVFVLGVPFPMRLPALLFHATNSTIAAHGIAQGKPWRFYLLAVFLHFLNNFSALYGNWWFIGGIGATILSYVLAAIFYRHATERQLDKWALA